MNLIPQIQFNQITDAVTLEFSLLGSYLAMTHIKIDSALCKNGRDNKQHGRRRCTKYIRHVIAIARIVNGECGRSGTYRIPL